jgi:glycosyltransferase involved in cell wall biosynthesis
MDVYAPSLRKRVLRAFKEEGVPGMVRRTGPYLARGLASARSRLWRRHRPPLTALVLASDSLDLSQLAESLLEYSTRRWSRWLAELLIITTGPNEPTAPADFVKRVPVRHFHLNTQDPSIAANTAVALARTDGALFLDAYSSPLTSAFLASLSTAIRRGVDVLCITDETPPPLGRPDAQSDLRDPGAVEAFLREPRALTQFALRRRQLINTGLFHPEDGEHFLGESLVRIWRQHAVFVTLAPNEPGQLKPVPRARVVPIDGVDVDRPPRVIYFVNGTDVRGGIRIVFEHCDRLRLRGIEAIVASFDDPIQTWFPLRSPLIAVRDLPPGDVAVATFWTTAEFVAQLNCARFYFIQHDEALFEDDLEWTESVRKTYGLPLEFITISSWLVDLIRTESGKDPTLIPNGINRDMFFPEPTYPKGGKIRILVEGNREIFWKGIEEAEAVLDGIDAEVWTLGNAGIAGARSFVGAPQDEVRRIYSSCDILLKTSWYEGMPLPHMEAMACGCALVTTDVPGVRDYCVDGWNCLTAEPRNVPSIREALLRVIGDPGLRSTLVQHGLETAEDRFGWDEHIDRLAAMYSKAAVTARQQFFQDQTRLTARSGTGFGRRRVGR